VSKKIRAYASDTIEIRWDARRCIHEAECVRGLPAVFDPDARPWIQPQGSDPEAIAEAVCRCPTGALQYRRLDGGHSEQAPAANEARLAPDGPVYLRGSLILVRGDGSEMVRDTRMALCRCGASQHKPFCDVSHRKAGFEDAGGLRGSLAGADGGQGPLRITIAPDGPLVIDGPLRVTGTDTTSCTGSKGALCRCGASQTKPFCDGSHKAAGFTDP